VSSATSDPLQSIGYQTRSLDTQIVGDPLHSIGYQTISPIAQVSFADL